jgi:hypothetical protein
MHRSLNQFINAVVDDRGRGDEGYSTLGKDVFGIT